MAENGMIMVPDEGGVMYILYPAHAGKVTSINSPPSIVLLFSTCKVSYIHACHRIEVLHQRHGGGEALFRLPNALLV
jgi:hypothetical protein